MLVKLTTSLCLLALLIACESAEPSTTAPSQPPIEVPQPTVKVVEPTADKSTLEGFWSLFQTAVAEQNTTALKALYASDATFYTFQDPEEMARIANSSVSEVGATGEQYQGSDVYAFFITFEAEDPSMEGSETSIYLRQNEAGDFEIFNVMQGG